MAFFADNFTDTDAVLLENHTPDLGTSWTVLWRTNVAHSFSIVSNQGKGVTGANSGIIYTADATYPSADYDITFTLVDLTAAGTDPFYAFVRIQDQENLYAVRLMTGTTVCQLYKKVSGTWSALGSLFDEPADGSVCRLEIIGTTLKFFDDDVEVASATVSDISAAGKAGIGGGGGTELVSSNDDIRAHTIDALTVNDLGAASTSISASDTESISVSETSSLQVGVSPTDTETLSITEGTSDVVVSLNRSDTLSISLTESSSNVISVNPNDTLNLSLSETSQVVVNVSPSDTLDLSISESASVIISVAISASDSIDISLTETSTVQVSVNPADTLSLSITESSSLVIDESVITVSGSDTLSISITETSSVVITTPATYVVTQGDVIVGDVRLYGFMLSDSQAYAVSMLDYNVSIPVWDGQLFTVSLEDDVVYNISVGDT